MWIIHSPTLKYNPDTSWCKKVFLLVKVSLSRSSHVFITHVVSVERADFRCRNVYAWRHMRSLWQNICISYIHGIFGYFWDVYHFPFAWGDGCCCSLQRKQHSLQTNIFAKLELLCFFCMPFKSYWPKDIAHYNL